MKRAKARRRDTDKGALEGRERHVDLGLGVVAHLRAALLLGSAHHHEVHAVDADILANGFFLLEQ